MSALQQWLSDKRADLTMDSRPVTLSRLTQWHEAEGEIRHTSGKFFSVVGLRAHASDKALDNTKWLLINQPEIGILGFVFHRAEDATYILLQAKPEPGNVGIVQIAPTVQATESNYTRVHGGKETPLLALFTETDSHTVSDSLQSEQGSKFLGKYNRNMCVVVPEKFDIAPTYFTWSGMDGFLPLLIADFAVNTDARSVLACGDWALLSHPRAPFAKAAPNALGSALHTSYTSPSTVQEATARLETLRLSGSLTVERIRVEDVLRDTTGNSPLMAREITTPHREVEKWDQPFLCDAEQQSALLLCQKRSGILHFLLHMRMEVGFKELYQFAPTSQSGIINGDLPHSISAGLPALHTLFSCIQSDEGGRFYQCNTQYRIAECAEGVTIADDANYIWVNLHTLHDLVHRPGVTTNELRTLVSMLLSEA